MRLSKHFTLQELIKSSTAERRGIKNVPERTEIESLRLVCDNILEPVRQHFGVPMVPSSGYRCLELNRAIGSGDTSQHVKGQAVDFEILEFYRQEDPNSGWVHCSYDNKEENRKESLRFDGKNWEKLKIA